MRLLLAALLFFGGPARAADAGDALTALFSSYEVPKDETAAAALPERGERLAKITADLTLAVQGLEAFRAPDSAERAVKLAPARIPEELRPRFNDRRAGLDVLYRTLAVADYTWASRFPGEACSARERRAALLNSPDGLFKDPKTGRASPWLAHLLGPAADEGAEAALDRASSRQTPTPREYELLRAKAAKATQALEAAPEDKRAWLYCLRAETYAKLAVANQVPLGPIAASRGSAPPSRGVALLGREGDGAFEAHGAGVLVDTPKGPRVLTDSKVADGGRDLVAIFPDAPKPFPLTLERDEAGLALLASSEKLGSARELAASDPVKDELVTVVAHTDRLGGWSWTQGLVSESADGTFQTDAVVQDAQAGGAVLNENGQLAGLLALRPAADEDGEKSWPVGVAASALKGWLEGGALQTAAQPVRLQDAGSGAILTDPKTLAESLRPGQDATNASYIYSQTQYGTVRGKCVANCGGGSSGGGSSYSSNPGAEALGRAMGEALGQGVRALFKGLGSLFKSRPNRSYARSSPSRPSEKLRREAALPPPKLEPKVCEVLVIEKPDAIGHNAVVVRVRLDCKGGASPAGQNLEVVVGWAKDETPVKRLVTTDAGGYAAVRLEVDSVERDSERQFDDLDRYDRELREKAEREAAARAAEQDGLTRASAGVALEKTKEVAASPQTAVTVRAALGASTLGVHVGGVALAAGGVAITGASVYLAYQRMKADVERQVAKDEKVYAKGTAELKSSVQNKFDDLDRHAQSGVSEGKCDAGAAGDILDRFVDQTRLSTGYLQRHEGPGHTIEKHVGKTARYLRNRVVNEGMQEASTFFDLTSAEAIVRRAIESNRLAISEWYAADISPAQEFRLSGSPQLPIGHAVNFENLEQVLPRYDVLVRLRRTPKCQIFILTSYPE